MKSSVAKPSHGKGKNVKKTRVTPVTQNKLYVLDTNVLMHDPTSLMRFQEHDLYIPSIVLEELDNHKKGHTEVARNSRETSRFIRALILFMQKNDDMWVLNNGLPLKYALGGTTKMGKIIFQTASDTKAVEDSLAEHDKAKADNHIIGITRRLSETRGQEYDEVILVSKDTNMVIKALLAGLSAQDYTNDRVDTDADKGLFSGISTLSQRVWETKTQLTHPDARGDTAIYDLEVPKSAILYTNQLVTGSGGTDCIVTSVEGNHVEVKHCHNYKNEPVSGITAQNVEQNFLLNLLMDPMIDFVTILGGAGSGKTLLTVAAALAQKHAGIYNGIIATRITVPIGEDVGFLPGGEEDKMGAWMGAIDDNLEVIVEALASRVSDAKKGVRLVHGAEQLAKKFSGSARSEDDDTPHVDTKMVEKLKGEIKIKAMTFMRGRTFQRKFVIIDEAQNLTPKQMQTLITRAGPGTKIVCLGNLSQIDTPYLTEASSGLAYVIDRFKGWENNGHVTLARVVRSRLAEHAVKVL